MVRSVCIGGRVVRSYPGPVLSGVFFEGAVVVPFLVGEETFGGWKIKCCVEGAAAIPVREGVGL